MFVHRVLRFVMLFCSLVYSLVRTTLICRFNSRSDLLLFISSSCTCHLYVTPESYFPFLLSFCCCCGLAYLVFFGRDVCYCGVIAAVGRVV
jgi:hypothetical protein